MCDCMLAQVVAGKDKGTVAEVEKVLPTRGMIVVKGVNVKVRPYSSLVLGRGLGLVFRGLEGDGGGWGWCSAIQE